MQQTGNPAEIESRCRAIIDGYLHRGALREGDINAWVKEVVGSHGEMAVWHAVRAGGFGGSEIGVLVRNHQGHRADHQNSAHDIVEGKLLRRVPDRETGHLRRGHENEPRHAEWFYRKYGAHRDEEAFKGLASATGLRPWMRYSPDEVALVPVSEPNAALGGRRLARWLIDYKAPSVVDDAEEVAFQYVCQLHQGALICARHGIHLDGLMLSQFDWAGWEIKDDHVAYDRDLAAQIVRAGDFYWESVLRGEVPAYVSRPRFSGEEEVRKEWEERANRIAQLKAMKKAVEDQLAIEQAPIDEHLAKFRMAGTTLRVGELTIKSIAKLDHEKVNDEIARFAQRSVESSAEGDRGDVERAAAQAYENTARSLTKKGSLSYDDEQMARLLRSQGVDLKPFVKPRFDEAKVYEFAQKSGLDADSLSKEELRMTPSEGLLEQARDMIRQTFGTEPSARIKSSEPAIQVPAQDSGPPNDREGRDTERSAPRSIAA